MRIYNKHNHLDSRQKLRKNSTPHEAMLWAKIKLKQLDYKFRRQHGIGPYIVDFYCPEKRLVIEIDGSQHLDAVEYDNERSRYFEALGITVLRFWNSDINANIEGVVMKIKKYLDSPHPLLEDSDLPLLNQGEGTATRQGWGVL